MILRVYQTGFGESDVATSSIKITETPTEYTVHLPGILKMSDRCRNYPVSDPRAWAYHLGFYCDLVVRASLDKNDNSINVSVVRFTDWKVERWEGDTPSGQPVVQGNYTWYSSVNGAVIAQYLGPTTAGQGAYTYTGDGGTVGIDFGNIAPQKEASPRQYANLINHVNGLRSYAWVTAFNDLPADYRPGATLDRKWMTHNRDDGHAHILTDENTWSQMRTHDGGARKGDIPGIITDKGSGWVNQRRIGRR